MRDKAPICKCKDREQNLRNEKDCHCTRHACMPEILEEEESCTSGSAFVFMRHIAGEVEVLESAVIRTRREGVYASTRVSSWQVLSFRSKTMPSRRRPNRCGEGDGAVEQ